MTIKELAETRSRCAEYMSILGQMNVSLIGVNPEKRIAMDAQYQLAKDAFDRADADYRKAIANLTTEELINIAAVPDPAKSNDQSQHSPTVK